jgi:hypothetical protein
MTDAAAQRRITARGEWLRADARRRMSPRTGWKHGNRFALNCHGPAQRSEVPAMTIGGTQLSWNFARRFPPAARKRRRALRSSRVQPICDFAEGGSGNQKHRRRINRAAETRARRDEFDGGAPGANTNNDRNDRAFDQNPQANLTGKFRTQNVHRTIFAKMKPRQLPGVPLILEATCWDRAHPARSFFLEERARRMRAVPEESTISGIGVSARGLK